MSDFLDRISKLSSQRLALLADELNERVQAAEKQRRVPLAVVGIGCRFPGGVHDPEQFWELLRDGVDAISDVPLSRWDTQEFYDRNPATPGKMATRWGGFIDGPEQFDPKFFGIAPTEAMSMDPQQRLLLETSWEALEHAGIAPSRLSGTKTGVFIGICSADYSQVAFSSPREKISPYFAPGLSHAVAAGRISYVLGFQGPSIAVDTSCSASLVAVHLACQSLRLGECNAALAGGVNLVLNPDITIALSQSRMMAPDGRCKAFSESANGFVRGEGCGMILLKRLPDAIRDRNRILAVIRGSACNQDGRSSGLTVPNGPSQEAVVAAALDDAGMNPNDVDYIEAHGTGTSLGDPIEAGALNAVFTERSKTSGPLFVGSVKTNLGHLESAAGIAGLMKLVLSIQHGKIPASLHFETPNSRIEWDHLPIRIPTELQAWNLRGRTRVGGVSSFGFSGTNAHVIVEEYLPDAGPKVAASAPTGPPVEQAYLFPLSAKTGTALATLAARLHCHLLEHPSLPLADIARTLNAGRSHFEYRAALVAASHSELLEQLHGLANNDLAATVQKGRVLSHSPRIAWVFGAEESPLQAAEQQFYECWAVFREAVLRCEDVVKNELGLPLPSPLCGSANLSADQTANRPAWYGRVAAFALQYALSELWRSCGIQPSVIFGYGIGEVVAASVAGVFSLHDGLRLTVAALGKSLPDLDECANQILYSAPRIHLLQNFDPVRQEAPVNSADYWQHGSRSTRPSRGALVSLAKEDCAAYLYMGDGSALQQFASFADGDLTGKCLASYGRGRGADLQFLHTAATLYVLGCELDMDGFSSIAVASTVSLPTYPFERERYWLDPVTEDRSRRNATKESRDQDKLVRSPLDAPNSRTTDLRTADGDEWIYDLTWEPKPLRQQATRSEVRLDDDLIGSMAVTPASEELVRVERLLAAMKPVYATYILRAVQEAGLSPLPTAAFSLDELSQRLKIIPARRRVLARMLAMLAEDSMVECTADRFRFVDFRPRPDAELALDKLSAEYPEMMTEINMLQRCGKKLLPVLRGNYDPMQLVFADGSIGEAEKIYEQSPVCRFFNDKAAKVVRSAVDSISERPARILEIGGGTGATTVPILSALVDKNFEYIFTDVSPVFLSRARIKFSKTSSMSYRILDIENDPVGQGFEAGSYDIIIAANVLHATADLRQTLAHIRAMLAPGGILLLVEGVRPDRWLDLTFGLTDGWWRSRDVNLRPEHPMVSAETWVRLLKETGIGSSRTISYVLEDGSSSQQIVIVAQVDADNTLASENLEKPSRHWMIFADEFGVGDALGKLLDAKGESYETIQRPGTASEIASEFRRLKTTRRQSLSLEVVYLWGMDVADTIGSSTALEQGEEICGKALVLLIQALLEPSAEGNAHLWIATRGAQATDSFSPSIGGALQSLAWGIGRVLGLEAPGQYRGLIDLDPTLTPEAAASNLLGELLGADREDQVAYRDGERLVARLKHAHLKAPAMQTKNGIRGDASYLIVGGLGGVGLQVARWTAEQGPGHLVLLSRTGIGSDAGPFAAERLKTIREIEALGVKVSVVVGDVASPTDVNLLFGRFGSEFPPLRGVFHAATVVSGAKLCDLKEETIGEMFRPKILGTFVLHEQTKNLDLDFFLAFSSTTSLLGAKWLAHYAAANQFLDSFAHYRRALGLPALSVNWGAWDTMWSVSSRDQERSAEAGLLPMPSQKVFNMFADLIDSPRAQVMIADVDWNVLKPVLESQRARPLLENFAAGPAAQTNARVASVPLAASLHKVMDMPPEKRRKSIEAFIREQAAQVLGFRRDEVLPADIPLTDLGLDSLMAVDLKNRLQAGLGQELSPTVVFDYPTVSGMVGLLETMLWAAHGSMESEPATLLKDEIRI